MENCYNLKRAGNAQVERDMADIGRCCSGVNVAHLVEGHASKFACTAFPEIKTVGCSQAWHVHALKDTAVDSCLASGNCKAALLISAESNVEDI